MEIDPKTWFCFQFWLLASVCVDCLCHFCAQADGIQQEMAKAFKRTRSKAPNSLNLAQIWTFPMKIDQKNVVLSQISVLASVSDDCLCHFCAQADRLQQKMTKGSKKSRLKGRI